MSYPFQAPRWFIQRFPASAPGAEFDFTPNRLGTWIIRRLCFTFATSAVVANRIPSFLVTDGNDVTWRAAAPAAIAAGITTNFTAYQGANPNVAANGLVTLGWPEPGLILRQGDHLQSLTSLIDVGDQYSAGAAFLFELPSGPDLRMDPGEQIYAEPQSW